ncbi:hypothetical protein QJ856_gp0252 [Tupanvirus deep ocean]|uniref:Uncharacterized protein n=2 Tax=Tupanvirus TaxID=2094720 RepID=A0AC62A9M4_9VIRU|nr:hypothetical protein QJ856_gp0252 [Tupanvirus deep ocean]QKU34480.1 hypothetical protein [Tupanvirus deep ocean]
MEKYQDLVSALTNDDLLFAETLQGLLKHHSELRTTYQSNYIDLKENRTTDYFFKLYTLENGKWEFFDYGWLKINLGQGVFYTLKSKLMIFNVENIGFHMQRRDDSFNHIMVNGNGKIFLLYNLFDEVIDILFKNLN